MTKANVQLVQPRRKYRLTGMLPLDFSLWLTDGEAECVQKRGCAVNVDSLAVRDGDGSVTLITEENRFLLEDSLAEVPVQLSLEPRQEEYPDVMDEGCAGRPVCWIVCPRCGGNAFRVTTVSTGTLLTDTGEAMESARLTVMQCEDCEMEVKL